MDLLIFSVFYNRESEVNASVSSIIEATPSNTKIILVNDGSTDKTLHELNFFKSQENVDIIDQENCGFSLTLSEVLPRVLEKYKCKYFAIHGAGDLCKKEKFLKQINYLEKNPSIVALGCGHETFSGESRRKIRVDSEFKKADIDSLYTGVPFTHGSVVYRTKAFEKAGGYNEYFKYCQDWEFYFRLIKHGEIVRFPEVLYRKYIYNDGASFKPSKRLVQLKYKELLKTRKISEDNFYKQLNKVKRYGIDYVYPDSEFISESKSALKSLLVQGELNIALEWCDLIYEITKERKQRLLKQCINVLISMKFPNTILAYLYRKSTK